MASQWRPVMGRRKATCKFNFKYPPDHESYKNGLLPLPLGDTVVILAETEDWFFGHTLTSSSKGLFPKSYVYYDEHDIEQEPLVAETNATLKEWYEILKTKFKSDQIKRVREIKGVMNEVMKYRRELATMKLTVEMAKTTREKLVGKSDFLNGLLGLDLVVRDANAVILEPQSTSAVSLFRSHVKSEIARKEQLVPNTSKNEKLDSMGENNSFRIMLHLKSFDSPKITDNVDLIIGIYDVETINANDLKVTPICENFVLENWKKNGNNEDKERRVQFGDLGKNDMDLTKKSKFLICNVVSHGNYGKYLGPGVELQNTKNFRKPVGVAAIDINSFFTFNIGKNNNQTKLIDCGFLEGDETETLFQTFKKFHTKKDANILKNVMQVELAVYYDNDHTTGHLQVAKKLGLPEVIFPSDVRNDLYVNILHGELGR